MSIPSKSTLVIGAGIAGIKAVMTLQRLGLPFRWISASPLGGTLVAVHNPVVDWTPRTWSDGKSIIAELEDSAREMGLSPERAEVDSLTYRNGRWEVCVGPEIITPEHVILATGSTPRTLNVPGEQDANFLYRSTTKSAGLFKGKPVLMVGGGDGALEGTLNLINAGASVTLVMRSAPRAQGRFHSVLEDSRVRVFPIGSTLIRLAKSEGGGVATISHGDEREDVHVAGAFIRIGALPCIPEIRADLVLENGYVVVDEEQRTSVPGLLAAGDVTAGTPSLATAADAGIRAAQTVGRDLRGRRNLNQ